MAKHQTIIVKWKGPVSLNSLKRGEGGGLYLFSGRLKYGKKDMVLYCGITERDFPDRFANHHKLPLITQNLKCWTGFVMHSSRVTRKILEDAETLIIYFGQLPLNIKKKNSLPKCTTLISHWFKANDEPRYNQQGLLSDFPDVISWDGTYWREGNLRVWDEFY